MSMIYKLFKKPMNLEDVADLLHKQGEENIQILCEAGTFYEPFINIAKPGERRKRFYINKDVDYIQEELKKYGINAGVSIIHGIVRD